MKDPPDLTLRREGKVDHYEFGLDPPGDLVTTATWWTHRGNVLYILDLLKDLVLGSIKPSSIVHPLPQ